MGVSLVEIEGLFLSQKLKPGGLRFLDIGCSNLYGGSPDDYERFLSNHGHIAGGTQLREYSEMISLAATTHPVAGGINGAWLGELLERVGCEYTAYDIFQGYRTTIFDLNKSDVLPQHRGYFDLVINCGTTEHVLNQINSFRVIHDATRVGGIIYHALPMLGYMDHGYFNYNPRLFLDLARANEYSILSLDFGWPGAGESVYSKLVVPYSEHGKEDLAVLEERWEGSKIPNAGIQILLKKISDTPFRAPFETTTTIGGEAALPRSVRGFNERLESNARKAVATPDSVSVEGLQALVTEFRRHNMLHAFPRALERRLIAYYLQSDPSRDDLRARLAQLDRMDSAEMPLVRVACKSDPKTPAALDGIEARIGAIGDSETRYREIVCCYQRYVEAGMAAKFPLSLEKEGLLRAMQDFPEDYDLIARLGKVTAAILVTLPLKPIRTPFN
jgi:hypothetical protein